MKNRIIAGSIGLLLMIIGGIVHFSTSGTRSSQETLAFIGLGVIIVGLFLFGGALGWPAVIAFLVGGGLTAFLGFFHFVKTGAAGGENPTFSALGLPPFLYGMGFFFIGCFLLMYMMSKRSAELEIDREKRIQELERTVAELRGEKNEP